MKNLLVASCALLSSFAIASDSFNFVNSGIDRSPTCYVQTVTIQENHCGEYEGTIVGDAVPTSCSQGQSPESTTTYYRIITAPTPLIPHLCNCGH